MLAAAVTDRHLVIMVPETTPAAQAAVLDALLQDHPIALVESEPFASIAMHGLVCAVDDGHDVEAVRTALAADPRVALVEPLNAFSLQTTGASDALLDAQTNLVSFDVLPAHAVVRGRGVRVAVIDSAVDRSHPDLGPRVVEARNFVAGTPPVPLAERHGTAVAGVIGACAGNGEGIVGVAPEADLLALRGCTEGAGPESGGCTSFALARAIDHAVLAGADVINLSLEGPFDALLARLIDRALAADAVIVASQAGEPVFPASLPGVLAVGMDERASSDPAAFAAPGIDVLTTVPDAGYDFLSGSSLATAHVSGLAALLREVDPNLSGRDIALLLRAGEGGAAGGSINACRSVRAALARTDAAEAGELRCR